MRFTVLRIKPFYVRFQPQLVNYVPKTRQWEIQIQCFGRQYTVFPDFLSAQNTVWVIKVKIIEMICYTFRTALISLFDPEHSCANILANKSVDSLDTD